MSEIKEFWNLFDALKEQSQTDENTLLSAIYLFLAEQYIIACTHLEKLDERLRKEGRIPVPQEKKNIWQRNDFSGLDFFYFKGPVHFEYLSHQQQNIIQNAYEQQDEESLQAAMTVIQETWKDVLAADRTRKKEQIHLYESLDHTGIVEGQTLLFGCRSYPEYDEQGNFVNAEKEKERIDAFHSIARQLSDLLSKELETDIKVVQDL